MICPHCGGSNFAWSRRCEHCARTFDTAVVTTPERPVLPELQLALPEPEVDAAARRRHELRAALAERGTRVIVTPAVIAANVVMFVVVAAQGLSFSTDTLLRWGGSYGPAVTQGAWWRLIAGTFLHAGFAHMGSNMFALLMIGPVAERLFGSRAFCVVYALAGIAGSLASEWWHPVTVGVGASGAIFGLYGSLFAFLLLRHTTLPPSVRASLRNGAVVVVLFNIFNGFGQTNIDNAGHLGGLVGGFIAGLALMAGGSAPRMIPSQLRSMMVASVGVVVAGVVVTALPRYGDLRGNLSALSRLEEEDVAAVQRSLAQVSSGTLTEDDCAVAIEQLLPPWRTQRAALAGLTVPAPDRAVLDRLVRYMDSRDNAWRMTAEAMRKRDLKLLAESQKQHAVALVAAGSVRGRRGGVTAGPELKFGSSDLNQELRRAQALDEKVTNLYNATIAKARSGAVSPNQAAQLIEHEIISPWQLQYERLQQLPLHGPAAWVRTPVAEYMRQRSYAWRLTAQAARERSPALFKEAAVAQQDAFARLRAIQEPQSTQFEEKSRR